MTYSADIEKVLGPSSPLDRPLRVTLFSGENGVLPKHAPQGVPKTLTLRSLQKSIETIVAREKDHLPLIALARFKGDYRNADNVETYSGAEGDYDAESVTPEEASRRLTAAGVAHLIYTSPSHTSERPRWRVFCPFSRDLTPEERDRALARINGVLDGILGDESFDRGRSYYIGALAGSKPTILFGNGEAVDKRTDLDAGAIAKDLRRDPAKGAQKHGGKVDRDKHLFAIAASCRRRRLTEADFRREAEASPIAWDHVLRDATGRARSPRAIEHTLTHTWKSAGERVEPYFGDITGVAPGGGDIENGRAFAARYKGEFLHVAGEWLRWDGSRWAPCTLGEHVQAAKALAGELMEAAAREHAERASDATKARLSRARATFEDRRKLASMLAMAETEPGVAAAPDMFDRDPWILGVENGLLDLKTGKLIEPRPDQYVRLRAGVAFDAGAECPKWDRFLRRVLPDRDVRAFFQRAAGYTLTGVVDEERWFFLHGSGANGKTTACEVLDALMGDYSVSLEAQHLMSAKVGGKDHELTKGRVFGKRLALANETKQGSLWDDTLMKSLAAKDRMSGRVYYANAVDFTPTHTLWVRGNNVPGALDTSDGFWRRMTPIEFGVSIPEAERIDDLDKQIIREELPGVLNWALRGLADWREGELRVPACVVAATAEYREDSDVLGRWMREHLIADPRERVTVDAAYRSYAAFCADEGINAPSKIGFGRLMASRRVKSDGRGGAKAKQFTGYTLKERRSEHF